MVFPGADAPGAPPGADRSPHLLVVPNSAEGQAALARSDARVVSSYREFTLVEAAGADDERLREAGADRRDDMREVGLPDAELDPLADRASLAAKGAPDRDEVLAVVQFVGPVKGAWVERLKATGARVVQYVAENGYLVWAGGGSVDRLRALVGTDPAVRAITPVGAGDKVEASLLEAGTQSVSVQTVAGAAGSAARRQARGAAARLAAPFTVDVLSTQVLRLDGSEVGELAADAGVVAMTAWSAPQLRDERSAQIVAGNLSSGVPDGPGYLPWLGGEGFGGATFGFAIDVTDSGLDDGATTPAHPDFYENGVKPGVDRVAYQSDYTPDPDARDCSGHGTNVASIAAGYGRPTPDPDDDGYSFGTGVAPRAQIGSSKVFDCNFEFRTSRTFAQIAAEAYAGQARISNNSWGSASLGLYDANARAYDEIVRDASPAPGNQEMVEVFAAGNEGGTGGNSLGYRSIDSPGSAKNVITVGASEGVRTAGTDGCGLGDNQANHAGEILALSSRGPTQDGRLKPDLVAPGSHLVGAEPRHPGYTGNDEVAVCDRGFVSADPFFYSLSSGTSQATPHVSGAAALIRDWFRIEGRAPPSPAMTKAVLLNAASDLAGRSNGKGDLIAPGPNHDQGWGRVNVGTALDSTQSVYRDQLGDDLITQTGESSSGSYRVANPALPLKVTLAWTDAPGPVGPSAAAYVNNLDLVVEAGGRTYKGNVFGINTGLSVAGGTADGKNNVESVSLPGGTRGLFRVKVVGANVPGDGVPGNGVDEDHDQDFALVLSNAQPEPNSPVLVHERSVVDDTRAGGDGDRSLEPGETFTLDETVRNAGDGTAAGPISGVLSGDPGLTVPPQPPARWNEILPGATQPSSPDPIAQISAATICGQDVTGTLALTTGVETQDIPLTMSTGSAQPATANSITHSPARSLPDNNAAGVTSTINVTRPGYIKDLDVRIGAILYPWIGDLRVDVVGPDGTTVTLADHPGGPDNRGDNMVGTVFDDEAPTNIAAGRAPYSGRFKPQRDQLSRFDGKQRQGQWKLRVRDLVAGDNGSLVSWGTEMSRPACSFGTAPGPQTSIQSGASGNTTQTSASFVFTGAGTGGSYECRLDSGLFVDCASGRTYSGLSAGNHTFSVRAVDSTGNVDASPAVRTWTVQAAPTPPGSSPSPPPPPGTPATPADTTAPSFALVPTEHSWTDARAGRLRLLAGCASACRVSATLTLSRATARRLGMKRTLGSGRARLTRAGVRSVRIRMSAEARAAARRVPALKLKARLAVSLRAGSSTVALKPTISLRSAAGLRSLSRGGLRLAGDCSERCWTTSQLSISARERRRLDLAAGGGPLTVAQGAPAGPSAGPFKLTLRGARAFRRALADSGRLNASLTGAVRGATGPTTRAVTGLKLRR